jgi:hypothetical protein
MKKDKLFVCACVDGNLCGFLRVKDFGNGDFTFDIYQYRGEGKKEKCIGGVVLDKKAVKKLISVLSS